MLKLIEEISVRNRIVVQPQNISPNLFTQWYLLLGGINIHQQILWHSSLQEVELNPLHVSVGWLSNSLPVNRAWTGENGHFTVEKPDRHTLPKSSRFTSPVISHINIMNPWYDTMRRVLHLCGIPLPYIHPHNPSLTLRRHQANPNWGTKYTTNSLQKCRGHEW